MLKLMVKNITIITEVLLLRTFVAINFPDVLKNEIQDIQNTIKPFTKTARWTRKENLHLTLKFLGEIDNSGKETAIKAIQMACEDLKPFEIVFDKLGYFGNPRDMRIMWIGTSGNVDKLFILQKKLEKSFIEYGFSSDEKGFKPHITIGRDVVMSQKVDLSSFSIKLDELYVDKVTLMLSENKGKGYYYTPICQIDL